MATLPDGFVRPAYDGASILNLPATVGAAVGASGGEGVGWGAPPLVACEEILEDGPYDRVVVVLLDGLGWDRWSVAKAAEAAPLTSLIEAFGGSAGRITSVAPSTTSVATTTLLGNGAAPLEHGLLGYAVRLPVPGLVANLLFWRPEHLSRGPGPSGAGVASAGAARAAPAASLESWGVAPEAFVARPSIFRVLAESGVASQAFMPAAIAGSPLSRAAMQGAGIYPWVNLDDALHGLGAWLAERATSAFAYLYVPDLDTLSHRDGPGGGAGRASLAGMARAFTAWIERLARAPSSRSGPRPRTLVLLTADHGHVETPAEQAWSMDAVVPADRAIRRMLACPPGGEPRHVYLYARAGAAAELLDACRERFGAGFAALAGEAAIAEGLYGPVARAHPEARGRIGDVILLARGAATFWWEPPDRHPLGMHGSLEPAEMEVPLLKLVV